MDGPRIAGGCRKAADVPYRRNGDNSASVESARWGYRGSRTAHPASDRGVPAVTEMPARQAGLAAGLPARASPADTTLWQRAKHPARPPSVIRLSENRP